jgi:hypothetical protein
MRLPNFGYHLARLHGHIVRSLYKLFLGLIARRPIRPAGSIDLDVFAYSSEISLPEQVASIRSFLRYAGRPRNFTVVSDGSHSPASIRLLEEIDPSVRVWPNSSVRVPVSDKFGEYLRTHPTGKQLALIMNLPDDGPALYADSDVLFFAGAKDLADRMRERDIAALYLADCQFAGDERLVHEGGEKEKPANTGVLLLFQKLDWSLSLARFNELNGAPTFFTNQTMTHLTMHQNRTHPFDPSKYVLQLDDQFLFRDRYAGAGLALRHYVNPVRHKFWTSLN